MTEQDRKGIELLLSDPEIVAWLGGNEPRPDEDDVPSSSDGGARTRRSGARTRGVANAAPMQRRRLEG